MCLRAYGKRLKITLCNASKGRVLSFLATLWLPDKINTAENQKINSCILYPDPGSNRDGFYSTGV